jgi:SAM-dependent methyltransferase
VCARLKVAAKATYNVTALPETFEALKLPAESVDTVVSTYMLNKSKQPLVTFAKAMDLLKDDGVFVFVEPVCGDNPLLGGIRKYLGAIHRATGAFGDPGLDLKNLVNAWAEQVGKAEGIELDLDVEEQSYFLDPHIVGVMYKRKVDRGPDYEPSKSEKRKLARRRGMTTTSKGFGSSS